MKLTHDDLLKLLSDVLKMERSQAEEELSEWVKTVIEEVSLKGSYQIPGLGTFSQEDNELVFTPDQELAIEVNHKYAGMKPIEIMAAYSGTKKEESDQPADSQESTGTSEEPLKEDLDAILDSVDDDKPESETETDREDISEPKWPIDEDSDVPNELAGDQPDETKDPAEKEKPVVKDDQAGDEMDPFGLSADDAGEDDISEPAGIGESGSDVAGGKDPEVPAESEEKEEDIPEPFGLTDIGKDAAGGKDPDVPAEGDEKEEDIPEPVEAAGPEIPDVDETADEDEKMAAGIEAGPVSASAGSKKPASGKKTARSERQSWTWLLPIAAALVLALFLFFHFEGQILDQRHSGAGAVPEDPVTGPVEQPTGEEPAEHTLQPVEEEWPLGLYGQEDELLIGSYTIVLHSITNENRARTEKENLAEEGYKATLWQAQLGDGTNTWRVGVGQFESIPDAENAISELPEPYRSNNFIIRIR